MSIPFYSNIDMNNNIIENAQGLKDTSLITKLYLASGSSGSSTFAITDNNLELKDGTLIFAYCDRSNEGLYGGLTLKVNGVYYPVYFTYSSDNMEANNFISGTVYQFLFDVTNKRAYLVGGYICNRADMYRYGLVKISHRLAQENNTVPTTAAVYSRTNELSTYINNIDTNLNNISSWVSEKISIDIFYISQMSNGTDCTEYLDVDTFTKIFNGNENILLYRSSGTGNGEWKFKVNSISTYINSSDSNIEVINLSYINNYVTPAELTTISFSLDINNNIVYKGQNGSNT